MFAYKPKGKMKNSVSSAGENAISQRVPAASRVSASISCHAFCCISANRTRLLVVVCVP